MGHAHVPPQENLNILAGKFYALTALLEQNERSISVF